MYSTQCAARPIYQIIQLQLDEDAVLASYSIITVATAAVAAANGTCCLACASCKQAPACWEDLSDVDGLLATGQAHSGSRKQDCA